MIAVIGIFLIQLEEQFDYDYGHIAIIYLLFKLYLAYNIVLALVGRMYAKHLVKLLRY